MKEIKIITGTTKVAFHKKLWHETEFLLAKCFGFDINIDTNVITADVTYTSQQALYSFIKLSFKNFSEAPLEEYRRQAFFREVEYGMYRELKDKALIRTCECLPYYDKLYQHQRDSIAESYYKKYNFLALEMGLGKTLIAASISRVHQIPRTVIVCPASVKWNWFRDLTQKFGFNELYFSIYDSTKQRTVKAFNERFVIINYDILAKFEDDICSAPIGHFILDEAHYLKSHTIGRYKNFKRYVDRFPDARITFLSGTPVKNRVNDVFAYLKLIGHELGQSYKKFLDQYTISTSSRGGSRVSGGRNLSDLYVKLSNFMIRKTKAECLDLPEKIFMQYRFEMDDYREEYNKIIEELAQIKDITSLTGSLHSLNIITSKAKIKGVIELAEDIISQGKKVVIFGGYKEPLRDLEAHFGDRCVKIDGSVNSYDRDQHVQKFTNNETCEVFLANMIAGGVGINLTVASDIIFLNFPFTPSELYQSMDRLHRIGQTNSVNVHYTFAEDSIDDYIYEIIVDKERDINALIDQGKEGILRENITEILIKKLLKRDVEEPHNPPYAGAVFTDDTLKAAFNSVPHRDNNPPPFKQLPDDLPLFDE